LKVRICRLSVEMLRKPYDFERVGAGFDIEKKFPNAKRMIMLL